MKITFWLSLILIIALVCLVFIINSNYQIEEAKEEPEPFTREYLLLNGKLAPELESPLEIIERKYNEQETIQ
jgi:preprotein translocase subunit SecG